MPVFIFEINKIKIEEIIIVINRINFHLFVKIIMINENNNKLKKAVLSPVM